MPCPASVFLAYPRRLINATIFRAGALHRDLMTPSPSSAPANTGVRRWRPLSATHQMDGGIGAPALEVTAPSPPPPPPSMLVGCCGTGGKQWHVSRQPSYETALFLSSRMRLLLSSRVRASLCVWSSTFNCFMLGKASQPFVGSQAAKPPCIRSACMREKHMRAFSIPGRATARRS